MQEEAMHLSENLELRSSPFLRKLNPEAVAEAISLEPIRRNSSTVSQSEEPAIGDDDFKIKTNIKLRVKYY